MKGKKAHPSLIGRCLFCGKELFSDEEAVEHFKGHPFDFKGHPFEPPG